MFEIIANDKLVEAIFESVQEKDASPKDKLRAIARAGQLASIYLDRFASPEVERLLHP